jgi:hypothetical protein
VQKPEEAQQEVTTGSESSTESVVEKSIKKPLIDPLKGKMVAGKKPGTKIPKRDSSSDKKSSNSSSSEESKPPSGKKFGSYAMQKQAVNLCVKKLVYIESHSILYCKEMPALVDKKMTQCTCLADPFVFEISNYVDHEWACFIISLNNFWHKVAAWLSW